MNPAVYAGLAGLLLACSAGPVPISSSLNDPSNPSAPEAATAPTRGVEPTSAPADGQGHQHGAPASSQGTQGIVYACPMHPEVTSNTPGACPICNMTLVARQ